jgi:hypothetical protein
LPKELEIISGDLQWNGDMVKGKRIELKAIIKPTKIGKWVIQTSCEYSPNPATLKSLPSYYLILYVFKDGADTVESPPLKSLPRVTIELFFSDLPALNEEAELTCRVVAENGDLPKVRIAINLSRYSSPQVVSGETSWEGKLERGITVEIKVLVKPWATGILPIMADVTYYDEEREIWWGSTATYLYLQVAEDTATLVPEPTRITPAPLPPR